MGIDAEFVSKVRAEWIARGELPCDLTCERLIEPSLHVDVDEFAFFGLGLIDQLLLLAFDVGSLRVAL